MFACCPLIVSHETLKGINSHSLICQVSSAPQFTGGRANIPADQGKGAFFLDDAKGVFVVSFSNLSNVSPDVDAGGAGPLAGGCTLVCHIFAGDATGGGREGDDILRAGFYTGAAAHTTVVVHHGKIVLSHAQGVKGADINTGPHPNTADGAEFASAVEHDRCAAIRRSVVGEDRFGLTHTVDATAQREIGFLFSDILTQDGSNSLGRLKSAHHTGVGWYASGCHGLSRGSASGFTTAPAIGLGQRVRDGKNLWVLPHIKYP